MSKKETIAISIIVSICITPFIILDVFFKVFTFSTYYVDNANIYFMFFMGAIVYTFIWAIVKKASKSTIIIYSFIFVLSFFNELKIMYTGEPIYFSDINFIFQIGSLGQLVLENVSGQIILMFVAVFLIYAIFLILIIVVNKKYDIELKNNKIRIAIFIVDLIVLVVSFFPNKATKEIFSNMLISEYKDYNSYVSDLDYYYKLSLLGGMYGTYLNNIFYEPDNYNEEQLDEILAEAQGESNSSLGNPNIVFVFSESFWDIDQLDEIEFNLPITKNFNELKEKGKFINLVTPSYGGRSENVVFEILTGGSMNYFSIGYIPVMSLYTKTGSDCIPSLLNVLKENGYSSEITFGRDYYNCEKAFKNMGMDEYYEIYAEDSSVNITDEYFTDKIIEQLESKEKGQNKILIYETYESHMPYYEEKYEEYDISIINSDLSDEMNETIRTYAQGIYDADEQLLRLYEYICTYDEPTILIFLGDHLPYLYTESGLNVLDYLEYFNTEDEIINLYRKYNTQAIILANYDISDLDFPEYLGTNVLLDYIVSNMDIEMNEYYNWLYSTIDILPASNRYISIDNNGNLYKTENLTGAQMEIYTLRNLMQYKYFTKWIN